ncbi:MAG: hypothetical protein C0508_00975 [Cyanobacteria bacterium PR.023]|nr:hypothetical protein [Cyanobacteria bacterium PR.3.49]MBA4073579.1 hypothetical protein [Cyanobacteria bacterium PR.023]
MFLTSCSRKNFSIWRKPLAIALAAQFAFCVPAAYSLSPELTTEEQKVEELTNKILHKEIDLERYYLQYRKIGTANPKFRRLRYYLLQVASTSCTLASNVIFTDVGRRGLKGKVTDVGRGDGDIDEPGPRNTDDTTGEVRSALILALIGSIVGPGSSLIELCSNGYTAVKNIKDHNNPASAVKNVIGRIKEIDSLLLQRKQLIDEHPQLRALAINKAEHIVLEAFRDWCISEFIDVYADAKSSQSGANVYYTLDVVQGSCATAGNILALKSLEPGKDRFAGPAANISIVSDGINIVNSPLSYYIGKRMNRYWRKRVRTKLTDRTLAGEPETKNAMAQLKGVVEAADDGALGASGAIEGRVAAYLMWSQRFHNIAQKQEVELRHRSKVAAQGRLMGPLLGGAGLAQDILASTTFYGVGDNERRGASLNYAGAITALSGNVAALTYTNGNFVGELIHRKKLRGKGLLPEQLLEERFRLLNQIDKLVGDEDVTDIQLK